MQIGGKPVSVEMVEKIKG